MFVEVLDDESKQRLYAAHAAMTVRALEKVFGRSEKEAASLVADLHERCKKIGSTQLDWLMHDDPINLAAQILKIPLIELGKEEYAHLVSEYNTEVRPEYEKRYRNAKERRVNW